MSKYCSECGRELEDKDLHIVIVLDESGSMGCVRESTISGINEFIESQRKEEGNTWITITKFDTRFRTLFEWVPLDKFKKLTKEDYVPDGLTALHDDIGNTINNLNKNKLLPKIRTMFVVMTDGEENSSSKFTLHSVKKLIDKQKEAGWDFVFLGANIDSYAVGGSYGINTTINYHQSNGGIIGTTRSMASYSSTLRTTGQSMGSASLQCLVDSETEKEEN
jgi:hypothetical protein